jgi:hypothetical protein
MKKIAKASLVVIILFNMLFAGMAAGTVSAQAGNNTICIQGAVESSNFPDVSLDFRASDANYLALRDLTQDNITIQEQGQILSPTRLNFDPQGNGINLYFILDRGASTDIESTKAMVLRFLDVAGVDGLDRVTIILSGASTTDVRLKTTTDFSKVRAYVNSISSDGKLRTPTKNLDAIISALNLIRGENLGCSMPSAIFMLGGPTVWNNSNNDKTNSIMSTAVTNGVPIFFLHSNKNDPTDYYSKIANASRGAYISFTESLNSNSSALDDPLFNRIAQLRGDYSVTYHSTSGVSGQRDVSILLNNASPSSDTQKSTYSVELAAPKVTLVSPVEGSDLLRTATTYGDPKFIYDTDIVPIEFKIEWPDGFDRVPSTIRVIGTTSTGDQTIQEINETEFSRSSYQLSWNVNSLTSEGANPFGVRVEVTDELGLQSVTTPSHFTVTNLIPPSVAEQTTEVIKENLQITQYMVYVLAGIIVLAIALIAIFWKKIKQAFSSGGSIGRAIETVRKTIVGGTGRRKNPIARLEVIRPTVEVKSIFTESVKLGRDPNVSDYTFYSLNSDCSVSGEHAMLVKKRDGWKIIATSQSGSPVFVDEVRIDMHQEVPLYNGQLIELGYQDLGSALFRFVEVESTETFEFAAESEFTPETQVQFDDGYRRTQVNYPVIEEMGESQTQADFDQQYSSQDFFTSTSKTDDDFDSLFDTLRDN